MLEVQGTVTSYDTATGKLHPVMKMYFLKVIWDSGDFVAMALALSVWDRTNS